MDVLAHCTWTINVCPRCGDVVSGDEWCDKHQPSALCDAVEVVPLRALSNYEGAVEDRDWLRRENAAMRLILEDHDVTEADIAEVMSDLRQSGGR